MAEKVVQHRHCQTCLKAIPIEEEFCNDECKEKWNQLIKANKKKNLIVLLWMVIVVIFAIVMLSAI
jgi:predicted nucleic acid-binding Zn ribbon protein